MLLGILSNESLKATVLRGSVWVFFGFGVQSLLRLGSNLILTRLLAPEIFGLMTLATVFLTGLSLFCDVGTRASVIRSQRGEDPDFLCTAWTVQVLRAFFVALLAAFLAWPVSQIYDQPALFPLIITMTIAVVVGGFGSIALATQARKIHLGRLSVMDILVQLIGAIITIIAAWALQTVWALVIGAIAASVARVVLSFLMLPPLRHRFLLERAAMDELVTFGRWIMLATMLTFVGNQGIQALQGLLVPIDVLGFLAIATILATLPSTIVHKVLESTAFPAISRVLLTRPDDLADILWRVRLGVICGTLPIFFILSLAAQPLIDLMYDPRYASTGAYLSIMALNSALSIMGIPYQSTILASGDSRTHAFVMGCQAVLQISGALIGFWLGSVIGLLVGSGIAFAIQYLITYSFAWRRGYSKGALDALAIGAIGIFYIYSLSVLQN